MLKNFKVSTKLGVGFAIVVLLAAGVGYVGYSGLGSTTAIVDKADDANRLIKYAKDCRQQEKNFMIRTDKKYQEENDATMKEIYAQIETTMAKLKDPALFEPPGGLPSREVDSQDLRRMFSALFNFAMEYAE